MTRYFKYGETNGKVDCVIKQQGDEYTVFSKTGESKDRYQFAFEKAHNAEADLIMEEEALKLIDQFGNDIKKAFNDLGL